LRRASRGAIPDLRVVRENKQPGFGISILDRVYFLG
jgi:hypothetical protein